MATLLDIEGGKIKLNDTNYELAEMAYGTNLEVIWPLNYTYAIVTSSLTIHYSEDKNGNAATMITADGYNYAYATANVQVLLNGTLRQTLQNQRLTPVSLSKYGADEPTERFYTSTVNGEPVVRAYHLHKWYLGNREPCVVEWGYLTAPTIKPLNSPLVYQAPNNINESFTTQNIYASYDGDSVITALDLTSSGRSNIPLYVYGNVIITGTYDSGDPMDPEYTVINLSGPSGGIFPGPYFSVTTISGSPDAVLDEWSDVIYVTFPENESTLTTNEYRIEIEYNGFYTYLYATVAAVQQSVYTYDNLTVDSYYYIYYDNGREVHDNVIPASGGSRIPRVAFHLRCKRNGVVQGTLYGVANNGEVMATATDD